MTRQDQFVNDRVDKLYEAAFEIFNLDRKKQRKSWENLRRNMKPEQVRDFHRFIYNLWPVGMQLDDFLPKPSKNKLRALYIGNETPRNVNTKVARYSLYADEIVVPIPLLNPRNITPDYNPIIHPEIYTQDTLEKLGFMMAMLPWYTKKKVRLIPSPTHYDQALQSFVLDPSREQELAKRHKHYKEILNDEIDDETKEEYIRTQLSIPSKHIDSWVKGQFGHLSTREQKKLAYGIRHLKESDPYMLLTDDPPHGEMKWLTMGSTFDVGEFLAQKMGAFMYTDNTLQWHQIMDAQKDRGTSTDNNLWSPLTMAFQQLEFKFLDGVNPEYASRIAVEGRLSGFRQLIKDVWEKAATENDPTNIQASARDFADQLQVAYAEAQKDWAAIDKSLIKWNSAASAAMIESLATGKLHPAIPLGGFVLNAGLQLINSTRSRKHFKNTVPMAIFIDLQRRRKT